MNKLTYIFILVLGLPAWAQLHLTEYPAAPLSPSLSWIDVPSEEQMQGISHLTPNLQNKFLAERRRMLLKNYNKMSDSLMAAITFNVKDGVVQLKNFTKDKLRNSLHEFLESSNDLIAVLPDGQEIKPTKNERFETFINFFLHGVDRFLWKNATVIAESTEEVFSFELAQMIVNLQLPLPGKDIQVTSNWTRPFTKLWKFVITVTHVGLQAGVRFNRGSIAATEQTYMEFNFVADFLRGGFAVMFMIPHYVIERYKRKPPENPKHLNVLGLKFHYRASDVHYGLGMLLTRSTTGEADSGDAAIGVSGTLPFIPPVSQTLLALEKAIPLLPFFSWMMNYPGKKLEIDGVKILSNKDGSIASIFLAGNEIRILTTAIDNYNFLRGQFDQMVTKNWDDFIYDHNVSPQNWCSLNLSGH